MDKDQLKNLPQRYGLKPNFTYGQNFLVDEIVLEDIVDAAGITETDNVLEIGPGIGNLTRRLCERAGFVLSVEKDPKFLPVLKAVKKDFSDNFRFEIADALEYDFQNFFTTHYQLPTTNSSYKVVANIPYYITGKILKVLMAAKSKPTSVTILTQKEVARNITAEVGDLSLLAISVQLYGDARVVQTVLAKSFYPAPKVDSAVLRIDIRPKPKYQIADEGQFWKVLHACFAGKRKQLHNTLQNNLHLEKDQVDKVLASVKINPAARPQELSIEQWIELTSKINKI